jgi:hypothetical protein
VWALEPQDGAGMVVPTLAPPSMEFHQ